MQRAHQDVCDRQSCLLFSASFLSWIRPSSPQGPNQPSHPIPVSFHLFPGFFEALLDDRFDGSKADYWLASLPDRVPLVLHRYFHNQMAPQRP